MSIIYKEMWKNDLDGTRLTIIDLINRLFEMANEKNREDINKKYGKLLKVLSEKIRECQ